MVAWEMQFVREGLISIYSFLFFGFMAAANALRIDDTFFWSVVTREIGPVLLDRTYHARVCVLNACACACMNKCIMPVSASFCVHREYARECNITREHSLPLFSYQAIHNAMERSCFCLIGKVQCPALAYFDICNNCYWAEFCWPVEGSDNIISDARGRLIPHKHNFSITLSLHTWKYVSMANILTIGWFLWYHTNVILVSHWAYTLKNMSPWPKVWPSDDFFLNGLDRVKKIALG